MARFLKNRSAALGQVPGEPVFIGVKKMEEVSIHVIDYTKTDLKEWDPSDIAETAYLKDTPTISWINVNGVHDIEKIKAIADGFGLHPLVTEDVVNTGQQAKMEEFDDHLFFVIKMMHYDVKKNRLLSEQLSIILAGNFLITFQERPGDVFEPVRKRIRKNIGRIRNSGTDYLAYSLLDSVVDNYFFLIERIGEQIEDLENGLSNNPGKHTLEKINEYKREMNYLRKSIRPAREFIFILSRLESDHIKKQTRPFLKDLLDITSQAVEAVDTYRIMLSDQLEIYNSTISNRLNEIMKVLTIFSAIFIPLTFIAGIYGTNFDYLPELHFKYSYLIFWVVLLVIAGIMLRFFRRKKWL